MVDGVFVLNPRTRPVDVQSHGRLLNGSKLSDGLAPFVLFNVAIDMVFPNETQSKRDSGGGYRNCFISGNNGPIRFGVLSELFLLLENRFVIVIKI
jgi:hypothetical protein